MQARKETRFYEPLRSSRRTAWSRWRPGWVTLLMLFYASCFRKEAVLKRGKVEDVNETAQVVEVQRPVLEKPMEEAMEAAKVQVIDQVVEKPPKPKFDAANYEVPGWPSSKSRNTTLYVNHDQVDTLIFPQEDASVDKSCV